MVRHGAVAVVVLSVVMSITSFLAGTVPLAMSLSQERMRLVSSLGVGLLVGTSLGVVLPEGIEMLYNSIDSAENGLPDGLPRSVIVLRGSEHVDRSYHAIALSLVSGYLIMHILTFLPPILLSNGPQSPIPMSTFPTDEHVSSGSSPAFTPTGLSNTTIGLCIHSLADGIALGSSAVSDNLALEGIVFFAIMLHKAPASFSLTAILLRESYPRHSARRQLLLFVFSSPLSTLLTYFTLTSISLNRDNISFWSGVFLLFSAGTLIFASTNVHLHTSEEEGEKLGVRKEASRELLAGVVGMCIPLVLASLGHGR